MAKGVFRIKVYFRRFARRFPWLAFVIRSFVMFSAAFGGAYGFISGSTSKDSGYDPHAFAIGASFLFALACVALATMSIRLPMKRMRMLMVARATQASANRKLAPIAKACGS